MKRLYKFLFPLAMVVSLMLSGCAAVQYPQTVQALDPLATIKGMQTAVNGLPGTYVLQQGKNLVLGWPAGGQYAWVAFSQDGKIIDALKNLCGNRACPEAASDLYNHLVNNGWQNISTGAIPPAIVSTVRQLGYLISIGASLPIVPVIMMPIQLDPVKMINPQVGA